MHWLAPLALFGFLDLDHVMRWIGSGGYVVLFGLLFACGLGLPLPEDIPLITSGVLIAQGHMHFGLAAVLAWCGIIGGDCVLYYMGWRFGRNITRVPFIGTHLNAKQLDRAENWFARYGVWVVAVGRLFAGIRGAMVVTAGTTRFRFWKFIIADGLAAVVSGGAFMFIGYKFGQHLDEVKHAAERFKLAFSLGAITLAILLVAFFWWRHKRRQAEAMRQTFPVSPENPEPSPVAAQEGSGLSR